MDLPIKWGFCCAGKIANDFSLAMDMVMYSEDGKTKQHEKVAVAARSSERAEEFAEKHGFRKSYGSYEDLANDSEVQIVYVSSVHPRHFELSKMYLNKNKHVLCEKPLTMSVKETGELVALAKEKKVFFMEGFWSRFFPAYQTAKKLVEDGKVGT